MKHFKISAFKIAFLQIFPTKNKFGNQIQTEPGQKILFLMISSEIFLKMECNYFHKIGDGS